MSRLTFRQLRQANQQRVGRWHPPYKPQWNLSDWFTATSGELGEAGNVIKKLNRWRDGVQTPDDPAPEDLYKMLADEIADTYIYLDLLAAAADIDLPTAIIDKFNRTSKKNGFPDFMDGNGKLEPIKDDDGE